MGLKRTDEFRKDAVRIALTSGLKRKQVADDYNHHRPHTSLDGLTPWEYHQRSIEDQTLNREN